MTQPGISDTDVFTSRPVPSVELHGSLASKAWVIPQLVEQLMSFIATLRPIDGSELDIELALHESLTNAVVHGNHEEPHKRVQVVCRCSVDGEVSITVRDQGTGFDPHAVPDPTIAENKIAPRGRGIYMMRALMDEVLFKEGGAVVHMRKKSNIASPSSAVAVTAHLPKEERNVAQDLNRRAVSQ